MFTSMQKTICLIADYAKAHNEDPIMAVQEYLAEKDSPLPRNRIVIILAAAREAQRAETRKLVLEIRVEI